MYCTPLNSCYGYDWSRLRLCWVNPPWSCILKMPTKAVLDRATVVVITPDCGQTGEAARWRPLFDRLTKIAVPPPDVPLDVPDGAKTPLPAPRLGLYCVLDACDESIPLSDLDSHICVMGSRGNQDRAAGALLRLRIRVLPAQMSKWHHNRKRKR